MRNPSIAEWGVQQWRKLRMPSAALVNSLAAKLDQHDPCDASQLQMEEPTAVISPLFDAVNRLIERSANAIALEQRFNSIAAHEIKTPLAGIRAQAQMAKRAQTQPELQESLQMVMTGVDQVVRVLDQLQDLTRIEGLITQRKAQLAPVNLQSVYLQVLPELRSLMYGRHIRVVDTTQSHWLDGEHFAIDLILRNLLANAILYTPEHGLVEVSTSIQNGQLLLRVDDSGSGIPEADRLRVFERYGRLHRSANEGIGLGLYMVQRAVQLHHASIALQTSPHGGLRAEVTFPLGTRPVQLD